MVLGPVETAGKVRQVWIAQRNLQFLQQTIRMSGTNTRLLTFKPTKFDVDITTLFGIQVTSLTKDTPCSMFSLR